MDLGNPPESHRSRWFFFAAVMMPVMTVFLPEGMNMLLRMGSSDTGSLAGYGIGHFFAAGLLYVFTGVLVYLKRPNLPESRVFLLMTVTLGVIINYSSPGLDLINMWNYKIRLVSITLLPATVIHLALIFPRRRRFMAPENPVWLIPYLVSLTIFFLSGPMSGYWRSLPSMDLVRRFYLVSAVLVFVSLNIWNLLKDSSPAVRIQSRMIFFGVLMSFFITGVLLFPEPGVSFAVLFIVFPISIAYAICCSDLFTIDAVARKGFGYALSVAAIIGAYSLVVVILNAVSPATDIYGSHLFIVGFTVAAVTAFRFSHMKIQVAVDRFFYRSKLDYKHTVISISNDLTSILDMKGLLVRIIHTVRNIMFIDSAGVILLPPEAGECEALFIHDNPDGENGEVVVDDCLNLDDPLISLMDRERRIITLFDLNSDPKYARVRESCSRRFVSLKATLILPLVFKGRLSGMLAMGSKKSGHFYTTEDIDLLKTLANQGAIAFENIWLAEKMKQEEFIRTNLARYVSPQVVDHIIHEQIDVNLGGDRKKVTVLISDIRDFASLTKTQPPDRLVAILNEYFTEMAHIIFENHGSLDKYIGDAIVAVFGSLVELENPTEQAVETALGMVEKMDELNRKWAEELEGFPMFIGLGIDTGEVFLGNVGSPERMEFTVIGTAVNTAQLLSDLADPEQILLSKEAAQALGGKFGLNELPSIVVKERSGELGIFEVVHDRAGAERGVT